MRPATSVLMLLALAGCGAAAPGVPGTGSGPSRRYPVAAVAAVRVTGPDAVAVRTGGGGKAMRW